MAWLGIAAGAALIIVMLVDAFEAMIFPRRVRHSFRPARFFYRSTWFLWLRLAKLLPPGKWRNGFLSVFGPLSLFALFGIWGTGLILGFALLHWSFPTALNFPRPGSDHFSSYLYFSGTTFFTLGYGDIVPTGAFGQALSVAQAGLGFGFLAVVISYLPVLYQAFSRREIVISLLDARAGSPPCAGELLQRMADARCLATVGPLLAEWERWSAELLESHLSYPVLSYYRSQHDNQSWLAALTTILDTCSLLIAAIEGPHNFQARLTFAMARHAAVDLGLTFRTPPSPPTVDRLSPTDLARLLDSLRKAGLELRDGEEAVKALTTLRGLYEPFVNILAQHFELALPLFQVDKPAPDNWQTSPWMKCTPSLEGLPSAGINVEHDD